MYGYIIDFKGLPETVWACETDLTNYSWKNQHTKNMLEIAIIKAEEITVILGDMQRRLKNTHQISCTVGNDRKEAFCKEDTKIQITSVAVSISDLKVKIADLNQENCIGDFLFLPAILDELSLENLSEVNILIHKLIKLNTENSPENKLLCASAFFEILAKVSDMAKKRIFKQADNIKSYYIRKIQFITERDYALKLTEENIARELGISAVYLSALYREVTGKTYSEYLLSVRMQKAVDLLLNPNISTAKVALLTGFCDESYFRKRFKNYFGITVKEYRLIKKGLTLYHLKPERKNI